MNFGMQKTGANKKSGILILTPLIKAQRKFISWWTKWKKNFKPQFTDSKTYCTIWSSRSLQAQVPICGWLMVIPWCVTLSGCRGWLLGCSNYFLYGDIGLFRMGKKGIGAPQINPGDFNRARPFEHDSVVFPVCKNRVWALEQLQSCTTPWASPSAVHDWIAWVAGLSWRRLFCQSSLSARPAVPCLLYLKV